jgi:NAD(P)-dependent dehydrogenase (short-subunit alcohol dehydrogenase family)
MSGLELSGRVALVTGAARGQGRAIVRRLLAAGASIIAGDILDDLLAELATELGERGVVGHLDVSDAASWAALVERGTSTFGGLDILVNNAGIVHRVPIDDETEEAFSSLWRINCLGPFLGMKAALPHLRDSEHASIINTSSTAGVTAWSMHASYVSSKWAVRGLTRVAALEFAPEGIRVNSVVPGPIATPMMIRDDDPSARDRLSNVPLGRMGEPEDIAEAVFFLASDRSSYITGIDLTVDGGQLAGAAFSGPRRAMEGGEAI